MKSGREHRVPLSTASLDVLERMAARRENEFIFPGQRSATLSPVAMLALLHRMGQDVVVHGFRSAFRDWVSETTNYSTELAELALAHSVGSKVEAAYRRGDQFDKRRRLMEAWSEFCHGRAASGTVIPLRAG